MRKLDFRPKTVTRVLIPERLRSFLAHVQSQIAAGDDSAVFASDDLLQVEYAFGGLVDKGGDQFDFTYFPGASTSPSWRLRLAKAEILDIALERVNYLNLWKCSDAGCENLFSSAADSCRDCDFVETEVSEVKPSITHLASSTNRQEWARGYLSLFPNAHAFEIIGAYNSHPELGERLGWFSLTEVKDVISKAQ